METKLKRTLMPPIGVTPKFILEEQRFNELKEAIGRFLEANWPIPSEILWEYNHMAGKLPKEKVNEDDDSVINRLRDLK